MSTGSVPLPPSSIGANNDGCGKRLRKEPQYSTTHERESRRLSVPTLRGRDRQPAQKFGQLPVLPRPEHQVPVIRHDTVAQQPGGQAQLSLLQHPREGGVIGLFVEQPRPSHRPVEHVVGQPACRLP